MFGEGDLSKSDVLLALKRLISIGAAHKKYQVLLIMCSLASVLTSVFLPFYIKQLFDELFTQPLEGITFTILIVLLLYVLSTLFEAIGGFISNVAETRASAWLKSQLFLQSLSFPMEYYDAHSKGEVISIATSDTEPVGRLSMSLLPAIILEGGFLISSIIILFILSPYIAVLSLITVPIHALSMNLFVKRLRKASQKEREEYTKSVELLKDGLDGVLDLKVFSSSIQNFVNRLSAQLKSWVSSTKKLALYQSANYGIREHFVIFLSLIVLGYAAILVNKGIITIGTAIASYTYLSYMYRPISRFAFLWSQFQRAIPLIERVYKVIEGK